MNAVQAVQAAAPRALFLPASAGQRFALFHPAHGRLHGALLYLHPLADEMNKARRMAALQSRALAAAGWAVLQLDLLGCGDSSGDFADAGWSDWTDDALFAARWLQAETGTVPWLWGLRAGCLLAAAAPARLPTPTPGLLLWQPPASGQQLLQQFLRLRSAQGLQDGQARGALAQLRAELADGRAVDIGGYALSPALARGLQEATLAPAAGCARIGWFETSAREAPALLPASQAAIDAWRAQGAAVHAQALQGPAFWQTTEIEDAPALLAATLAFMAAQVPA